MVQISDLPDELIEHILSDADPIDVSNFSQTSKDMHALVYCAQDQHLWRTLYLFQNLDDPRQCLTLDGIPAITQSIDWKALLQDIISARSFVRSSSPDSVPEDFRIRALKTLLSLITQTPSLWPRNSNSLLQQPSRSLRWVYDLLQAHPKCLDGTFPGPSHTEKQLRCQLYTYCGITVMNTGSPLRRVQCRGKTYDMHSYRADNHFGPYLPKSDIPDWEQLLAIHHVLAMQIIQHGPNSHHIDEDSDDEDETEHGWDIRKNEPCQFPHSLRNSQIHGALFQSKNTQDWAGVEGKYLVSFCFCDHEVLIEYNTPLGVSNNDLDDTIFMDPSFIEIYRTISVELQIITVHEDGTPTPKISFSGQMGLPRQAIITGSVQRTKSGDVRWSFICGESNAAIWSCEGVQIGGVSSKYGALGVWTTIFHNDDDPIGPFWLRKVVETETDDDTDVDNPDDHTFSEDPEEFFM